jgi:hypothetical protein
MGNLLEIRDPRETMKPGEAMKPGCFSSGASIAPGGCDGLDWLGTVSELTTWRQGIGNRKAGNRDQGLERQGIGTRE